MPIEPLTVEMEAIKAIMWMVFGLIAFVIAEEKDWRFFYYPAAWCGGVSLVHVVLSILLRGGVL